MYHIYNMYISVNTSHYITILHDRKFIDFYKFKKYIMI